MGASARTDALGRDLLSRMIYGAQISLCISVAASLIAAVIGTVIGMIGGYYGGRVDAVVLYIINVKLSLPIVLGRAGGDLDHREFSRAADRYSRAADLGPLRSGDAKHDPADARAGIHPCRRRSRCLDFYIITRELFPNLLDQIIVLVTLEVAILILVEAALSFLGLGVPPPTPTWGSIVSEGRSMMFFKPHMVMIPGVAILILVIAINLAGDASATSPLLRAVPEC